MKRRVGGTQPGPAPPPSPALHSAPTQEVDAAEIQVQVCLYAFDLIYLNGEVSPALLPGGGVAGRGRAGVGGLQA